MEGYVLALKQFYNVLNRYENYQNGLNKRFQKQNGRFLASLLILYVIHCLLTLTFSFPLGSIKALLKISWVSECLDT